MELLEELKELFVTLEYGNQLKIMFERLRYTLPGKQDMLEDRWEIIKWVGRPGNNSSKLLDFSNYKNEQVKFVVKLCILSKREEKGIGKDAIINYYYSLLGLDAVIGNGKLAALDSDDFYGVQQYWESKNSAGYQNYFRCIKSFANWYSANFDPFITYEIPTEDRSLYGREGTDEGRRVKRIPDEVIGSLFALAGKQELSLADRFYLNALVLDVVVQGRVNELATMPLDCLIESLPALRVFSEKSGKLDVRFFPKLLLPVVKKAYECVVEITSEGRKIVANIRRNKNLDWGRVVRDEGAIHYHVSKSVAEWVKINSLIDPKAIWAQSLQTFVDPSAILERCKRDFTSAAASINVSYKTFKELLSRQEAASQGRLLFINQNVQYYADAEDRSSYRNIRKDPRAVGLKSLERFIQYSLYGHKSLVYEIVDAGLKCQMLQQIYHGPDYNSFYEEEFNKTILPTVSIAGVEVLAPEDALFVVPRGLLTAQATRFNDYSLITNGMFSYWLDSSKAGDDSLFLKHDIINPQTGRPASFNWHDIRHWMQTVYMRGGLTDAQVSLLAGRRLPSQAGVYDQIFAKDRSLSLLDMREAIRGGNVHGAIAETFSQIRIHDEQAAEEYLVASTQMVSWMPHGTCSLNVVLTPCVNHLSCFVDKDTGGCCSKLGIHSGDGQAKKEMEKIELNSLGMMEQIRLVGGEGGAQFSHFQKVHQNVSSLLDSVFLKEDEGDD